MKNTSFILLISLRAFSSQLSGDVEFWSNQFKEHAEFCSDFTPNQNLKEEARDFITDFAQLARSSNKSEFIERSKDIRKFQKKIASSIKKNDPDYSIKQDLIDHMNKETDYAIKRVSGKISPKDEIKFWNEEHKGEAKATAYFIERDASLKKEAKKIEEQLKESSKLTTVEEANQELDALGKQLDAQPQKTRMPKKLAKHEERERARAQQIFKQITTE